MSSDPQQEAAGQKLSPSDVAELWALTYILMGLRWPLAVCNEALKEPMPLIEGSRLYQGILAVGRIKGRRKSILAIGGERFGEPDSATAAKVENMVDEVQLERMQDRLWEASGWQDLLNEPMPEPIIRDGHC